MNITMPFRPFRSQSRVEFIKKKFENSFSEDGTGSSEQTNIIVPCKLNFLQESKDFSSNQKVVNSKIKTGFGTDDVSKWEGKTSIKRSPAFRREKLGCTKSDTQTSLQISRTLKKFEPECLNQSVQKKILKTEVCEVNSCNDFKKSKTDTNLQKYYSSRNVDQEVCSNNSKNANFQNLLVFKKNKDSENEADEKVLAQYSIVNKKKDDSDKCEAVTLRSSESIRKALQSPLPKGPPPKKPPRTFHHVPRFTNNNSLNEDTSSSSISSSSAAAAAVKNDIPKLKLKLEKLEKVIRIHETGTYIGEVKDDFDKKVNKISGKMESHSLPDVSEICLSCLPISTCQNLKKLTKTTSEFYLEIDRIDSKSLGFGRKNEYSDGLTGDDVSVKLSNSEAIYDLPYVNKKNSFETFGKCVKDLSDVFNAKKEKNLHYMCTDVINPISKYSNFIPPTKWRKSIEEKTKCENQIQISNLHLNFLTNVEKQKSSSVGRIDNIKELENDSEDGKYKRNETNSIFTALEKGEAWKKESSEESELDFLAINSFDCNEMEKNNEAEKGTISGLIARRKIYVSRVSSKLMSQIPCSKYKNKTSYKHLFECCLLVGLTLCESKQNVPYIKSVFPPEKKPPPLIEFLCFPDASYWPPTSENHRPEEQCYSLVVTSQNGERKFGYCRRVLPEGGHVCLPLAYCIISPHRAGGFFYKVLEELESRHGSPGISNFIQQLYESEFPRPGERLKLKEILEEATKTKHHDSDVYLSSTLVRRPLDIRLEERDLTQLLQQLQLPVFLKIFSSLLLERKVLLLSNSLRYVDSTDDVLKRNLSSCIEALQLILLPFSWQHTYIPVLPVHLIEICEAPTPYVIGVLKPRNIEKSLTNINFEDGILIDLDDSKILKCCGDEGSILPSRFIKDLKISLNLAMNATDLLSESVRSVLISDAFIRFFVQVCGNYSKFIQNLPNGEKIFQKDEFVKCATSSTIQSFLDWFTETAMFKSFIQERLQGDNEDVLLKLFRRRAMEYSEESIKDSAVLLKNYRVINKKVRTLGDKIKDFTSFTK